MDLLSAWRALTSVVRIAELKIFSEYFLIVVNPDWACCFCLKNGLFFNRFSKFTKTVKKEADIFTKCAAGFRTGAVVWFRTLQSCSRCGKPVPVQEH